jgi:ADP-dependent phosphofructokinase/glucokinase
MNGVLALGLGDNTDYEIVWDSRVFEALILEQGITRRELRPIQRIHDVRELVVSVLGFINEGKGGECYVEDLRIITEFSERFEFRITIGGTAPRAAIAMSKIGIPSSVHLVTINDHIRRLLPPDVSWSCSNKEDSSYPHMIVQFIKGTRVASGDIDITAPVSSRIIYDNDYDNKVMRLEPEFFEDVGNARAFLVSGFNAMQDGRLLLERVKELDLLLDRLPETATVFYENACFPIEGLRQVVLDNLSHRFDVFSLNEDEMEDFLKEKVDLLDPEGVLESVMALREILRVPAIVVHTRHWALASGADCAGYAKALKHGISMATTRFRLGDDFSREDFLRTHDLPDEAEGGAFAERINRIGKGEVLCLPSVAVEERNVTTIGLGDTFVGGFLSTFV